eukprot:g2591.t1
MNEQRQQLLDFRDEPVEYSVEENYDELESGRDSPICIENQQFIDTREQIQFIHNQQQNITIVPDPEQWKYEMRAELDSRVTELKRDFELRFTELGRDANQWSANVEKGSEELGNRVNGITQNFSALRNQVDELKAQMQDQTRFVRLETTVNDLFTRFNQQPRIERTVVREVPPELQIRLKTIADQQTFHGQKLESYGLIQQSNSDRISILESKIEKVIDRVSTLETKINSFVDRNSKNDALINRFPSAESKIDALIDRIAKIEAKFDSVNPRFTSVESDIDNLSRSVSENRLGRDQTDQNREQNDQIRDDLIERLSEQLQVAFDRIEVLENQSTEYRSTSCKSDEQINQYLNQLSLDPVKSSPVSNKDPNVVKSLFDSELKGKLPVEMTPVQVAMQTVNLKPNPLFGLRKSQMNALLTSAGHSQGSQVSAAPTVSPFSSLGHQFNTAPNFYSNVSGNTIQGSRPPQNGGSSPSGSNGGGNGGGGGSNSPSGSTRGTQRSIPPTVTPLNSLLSKIPPPDKFKGDGSIPASEWLIGMCRWLRACHVPEADWISLMMANLAGSALSWINSVDLEVAYGQRLPLASWSEFATELRSRFEPITAVDNARDRLRNLKQTTTVDAYIRDFQRITFQIPDMSQADKKANFVVEQHIQDLREVLERLRKYKLFAKASKCEIAKSTTEFVGHVVSESGIYPMQEKIKAIQEWTQLGSVTEVRSFLGMASFYRKFIPQFAKLSGPLNDLTKKGIAFQFGTKERKAMEKIKEKITNPPVLILPDPTEPYTVVTDASQEAVGAVLCQDQGLGLQPIAFFSKRLSTSEQKYSAYERELAAAALSMRHWRHYIEGCPGGVTLMTDHQPLTHLMSQAVFSRVQSRWIKTGYFQSIMPKIVYVPGKSNVVADALSRSMTSLKSPVDTGHAIFDRKLTDVENGGPESSNEVLATIESVSRFEIDQESWIVAVRDDRRLRSVIDRIESGETVQFYRFDNQMLRFYDQKSKDWKLVVPENFKVQVIRSRHEPAVVGHLGMERTLELISRDYWWRGMREDIRSYIRACPTCQVMKTEPGPVKGLLQPIPLPEYKWQQITIDLVTDFPESNGYTAVAVFVDRLTKMVKFAPCTKEITAVEYAELFFRYVFCSFGCPEAIISDRDPRFLSKFWTELFKLIGTKLKFSTAYHPETDGQSEVTIRTLENFLRPYVENEPQDWSNYLHQAEFAANNSINLSTGYSPFYLMYGCHPQLPDTLAHSSRKIKSEVDSVTSTISKMQKTLADAASRYEQAQDSMLRATNRHRRDTEFVVGDSVLIRSQFLPRMTKDILPTKLRRRYIGPFTVCKKISPVAYQLELPTQWKIHNTFHISKLRKFYTDERFHEPVVPPPPTLIEDQEEYEVERILRHRGTKKRREFLVLWKGYPVHEATWEPFSNLANCPKILNEYQRSVGLN